MTDYILIVSLALLAIGIALFIALPFCRMADDGDDEQAPPVDSNGFPFDPNLHAQCTARTRHVTPQILELSEEDMFGLGKLCETLDCIIDRANGVEPTEPTPLECAEARVAMGEPVASAARNEGIPLAELMDYLRAKECQPTK